MTPQAGNLAQPIHYDEIRWTIGPTHDPNAAGDSLNSRNLPGR